MCHADRPFAVAVVVPSATIRTELLAGGDLASATVRVLNDMRFWAVHHHLRPIEVPQAVYLELQPWVPGSAGLLTATLKKVRNALGLKYASVADDLYASCDDRSTQKHQPLSAALRAILPCGTTDVDPRLTFSENGGDSLAAIVFSAALERAGRCVCPSQRCTTTRSATSICC